MPGEESAPNNLARFVPTNVANESMAGKRTLGPKPTHIGTTSFQGSANPVIESRIAHAKTADGYRLASSNMAHSVTATSGHHPNRYVPPKHNREQRPPSPTAMRFYGPSLSKGNNAHPEASVYGLGGGGAPYYLRGSDNGKDSRTAKV